MQITKISSYVRRTDNRGLFIGVMNRGIWQEVNYVQTRAGAVRGNHFHKETHEVVFLLKGQVEIEFQDANHPERKRVLHLEEGEGVEITPYALHIMKYLTDCTQISLLDRPFDPGNPDLHTLEL